MVNLGYYARARNLLKCARAVVALHGGQFPTTREGLLTLPGIGPYTASAIAAMRLRRTRHRGRRQCRTGDGRLHRVEAPLPAAKPELQRSRPPDPGDPPGRLRQAVMDLGAAIYPALARLRHLPVEPCLPRPRRRPPVRLAPQVAEAVHKPTRHGKLWQAPQRGDPAGTAPRAGSLLGGMLGIPGDGWDGQGGEARQRPTGRRSARSATRFTHFHLILRVHAGHVDGPPTRGDLIPRAAFRPADLPTVMRKARDAAPDRKLRPAPCASLPASGGMGKPRDTLPLSRPAIPRYLGP